MRLKTKATLKFTYEKTVDSSKHFATEPLFSVRIKGGTGEFAEWQSRFYQSSPILFFIRWRYQAADHVDRNLKPEPRPQGFSGFLGIQNDVKRSCLWVVGITT